MMRFLQFELPNRQTVGNVIVVVFVAEEAQPNTYYERERERERKRYVWKKASPPRIFFHTALIRSVGRTCMQRLNHNSKEHN